MKANRHTIVGVTIVGYDLTVTTKLNLDLFARTQKR